MRIVVGGASGMIGRALVAALEQRGDTVVRLVRGEPASALEVRWHPETGAMDAAALAGADAVVNLSGASIAKLPWTRAYRAEILASRITATTAIVSALHELDRDGAPVPVLVSGSAVGFYGDRPGETLTEDSAAGGGLLARVVREWEAVALGAPDSTRVVLARTGLVIAEEGATAPIRALARFGLAGPLGGGRQHWPWISLADEVGALVHLIDTDVRGPVNLAGPNPATAAEVTRAIAASLNRPYGLPAPGFALRAVLGQAADELLLGDQLVVPEVLTRTGYVFQHPDIEHAVAAAGN